MRSEGDGHRKKKAFVRAQKMLRSVSTMAQKSENNAKIFSMSRKRIPLSFVFGRKTDKRTNAKQWGQNGRTHSGRSGEKDKQH